MDLLTILSKYFEVYTDREVLEKYSMDYSYISSEFQAIKKLPIAVISIKSEDEVKSVIELANEYSFNIIVRGAGTNTLGETVPMKENTVVLDITKFKGFEKKKDVLISRPGNDFNDTGIHDFPVIPTSFYMATIGGYAATGAYGFGALKNGAIWDNLISVEVYTPKGFYELSGSDLFYITLSAGTTGIITRVKVRLVNRKDKKINVIKRGFNSLSEALDFALDVMGQAEFLSIRNYKMAKEINPEYNWGKWNVIYGVYGNEGDESYAIKDIITSFAGSYFTVVSKRKVNYNSRNISLDELQKDYKKIEDTKSMVNMEFAKSSGKIFARTYILDFNEMPELGYYVNLHSYRVNDIVKIDFTNHELRVKKLIEFKEKVDPEDILNPGKLIIS
ncbi:MAG: FAD-binding oxidoreductase [Sulfolobus sp.]